MMYKTIDDGEEMVHKTIDDGEEMMMCEGEEAINEREDKIANEGSCSKLVILRLSDNHIGNDGVDALTQSLEYLPVLETIDLSRNQISKTSMDHTL